MKSALFVVKDADYIKIYTKSSSYQFMGFWCMNMRIAQITKRKK